MKHIAFLLIVLAALLSAAADKKPRVAVLAFTPKGVSQMEAETVAELFSSELVSTHAFDVLDRANMDNVLKEQSFQQTGCTESACAVKIGKILNVEFMIYGVVMNIGDKYYVSASMVNIETSKIEKSGKESVDSFKEINLAVRRLAEKLTGITMEEADKGTKIKYFGRITEVKGNEIAVNAGKNDGVKAGDECTVLSGKKIKVRNDKTGMMENVNERTELGRIKLTSVDEASAKGTIVSGTLLQGSMVDLNTLPYNNPNPWVVGAISLLSPAAGQLMVKDNTTGKIVGAITEGIRDLLLIDMLLAFTFPHASYINEKWYLSPITKLRYWYGDVNHLGDQMVISIPVILSLTAINTVWAIVIYRYNIEKYDELSKFAVNITPTPQWDGVDVKLAFRF